MCLVDHGCKPTGLHSSLLFSRLTPLLTSRLASLSRSPQHLPSLSDLLPHTSRSPQSLPLARSHSSSATVSSTSHLGIHSSSPGPYPFHRTRNCHPLPRLRSSMICSITCSFCPSGKVIGPSRDNSLPGNNAESFGT